MERPIYFDNIYELIYDLGLSMEDSHLIFNLLSKIFGNQKIIKYYFDIDENEYPKENTRLWHLFNEYLKDITGYNDEDYGLDYVIIEKQ